MNSIINVTKVALFFLVLNTAIYAKPNLPLPIQDVAKMEKLAGPAGAFVSKENFPKDYFLITKNLPFLVGMTLYDPSSSNLELSQEQIDAILKIKKELMAEAAKKALVVKKLELDLMQKISFKHKTPPMNEFYPTVDEIAKLRAELTKIHLECIEKVKAVLTPEQFEEMLDYGVVNMF